MTKNELIKIIQKRFATYPVKDVAFACNNLFNMMTEALKRGERIEIRGFGVFSVRTRRNRTSRNPKDGTPVFVSAQRVPFFKMSLEIKKGFIQYD
ncbi:MAG: integration host factor subunit beta [Syntrophaceae bacterium]|nr:integration host factor subunit beta [Syntrophaceae bacterium]